MDLVNWDQLLDNLMRFGLLLGKALIVFFALRIVARIILKITVKVLQRREMDEMLVKFIASIGNAFLMLIVVIASLNVMGVDTTSLIAVLASAGLAIGLALQDSMKNFASGVLLLTFKPFGKGDYIEAGGTDGVVQNITLFTTVMLTTDNKEVIVPNAAIWSDVITNYNARDTRRVDMVFGIGYRDDIAAARAVIDEVLARDDRILAEPQPYVAVAELADSSVNFVVRPWTKTEDYWAVKFDVTERIKLAFDERGISIPFPQVDVHMEKVA
jgi:small conductance mechanosensitive channel